MKRIICLFYCGFFAVSLEATPKHLKKSDYGEYLEYDIESKAETIQREFIYHSKHIIKLPLLATRHGSLKIIKKIHNAKKSVQKFFSNSRSVQGKNRKIKKAINNWQGLMYYNDYRTIESRDEQVSLLNIADDSWYLLKRSLYNVGVDFPRETYRTLKAALYGAFGTLTE